MSDLLERYSFHQIIGLIATEGIHYMGTLDLRDGVVSKAFGREKILWAMAEEYDPDNWQEIWDNKLQKARASTPYGKLQ